MEEQRACIAIDLKSFYASAECVERGYDPLKVNLVVADESRTDKTICLAVSPSLKALGISGRPRLFEVRQKVREINRRRLQNAPHGFHGKSIFADELDRDPGLELDFVAAMPHMSRYMEVSRRIYSIYLRYIAPEDIHVYSIDEVFIEATHYLNLYQMSARDLAERMIRDVLAETGITATAGIGTNLYLAKAAMDIVAKHIHPNEHGVRIAELNEPMYRRLLWAHEPLTDFWRIGSRMAARLNQAGMYTMGDIARTALKDEGILYGMFGVNAEYLIDHAFGMESTTIQDIRHYVPENRSIVNGQVLAEGYSHDKGRIIIREMAEQLASDMVRKQVLAENFTLYIGYDIENVRNPILRNSYQGEIVKDWYGREVPRSGGGSIRLREPTNSARKIVTAMLEAYEKKTDHSLLIRRVHVSATGLLPEKEYQPRRYEQMDLFRDPAGIEQERKEAKQAEEKERRVQEAMLEIQKRFGKNAILKGTNLEEGATTRSRNEQIGGHRA